MFWLWIYLLKFVEHLQMKILIYTFSWCFKIDWNLFQPTRGVIAKGGSEGWHDKSNFNIQFSIITNHFNSQIFLLWAH